VHAKKGEHDKAKQYLAKAMEMGLKGDYLKEADNLLKSLN
jgi:hypothetical protein